MTLTTLKKNRPANLTAAGNCLPRDPKDPKPPARKTSADLKAPAPPVRDPNRRQAESSRTCADCRGAKEEKPA